MTSEHDRRVCRQVRIAEHAGRAPLRRRLDPGEAELPARGAASDDPSGRSELHEPSEMRSEPSDEEPRELDLEAAGEHDLSTADDACVERRVAQAQRDDGGREWAWRRCSGWCRRLGGLRRERRRRDRADGDDEDRTPIAHAAQTSMSHARPRRTSTGVPVVAKAYISGASRAIIRTHPCEAGYAGT